MKQAEKLMKKYGLTMKDLPAFPPKVTCTDTFMEKFIILIGEEKNAKRNITRDA